MTAQNDGAAPMRAEGTRAGLRATVLGGIAALGGVAAAALLVGATAWLFGPAPACLAAGCALAGGWAGRAGAGRPGAPQRADVAGREDALETLSARIEGARTAADRPACLVAGLDEADRLRASLGAPGFARLTDLARQRLRAALRDGDRVFDLGNARFAIILSPSGAAPDLEDLIQIAARLQAACEEPFRLADGGVSARLHVGVAPPGDAGLGASARDRLDAAESAATEAAVATQGGIRVFPRMDRPGMGPPPVRPTAAMEAEIASAIGRGEFTAWFEPAVSTDTGEISCWTVAPQWIRPRKGRLEAAEFMDALRRAGAEDALARAMLRHAFEAAAGWGALGAPFGSVAVEVPTGLLQEPQFATRLRWEMERFDLPALSLRLIVSPPLADARAAEALLAVSAADCAIDAVYPDTGYPDAGADLGRCAPLIGRLRLPERLGAGGPVAAARRDEAARLIACAERLGPEPMALGVGSRAACALLAQLGCRHLSGPAIAPAMPFDETADWIARHERARAGLPQIFGG